MKERGEMMEIFLAIYFYVAYQKQKKESSFLLFLFIHSRSDILLKDLSTVPQAKSSL